MVGTHAADASSGVKEAGPGLAYEKSPDFFRAIFLQLKTSPLRI